MEYGEYDGCGSPFAHASLLTRYRCAPHVVGRMTGGNPSEIWCHYKCEEAVDTVRGS